MSAGSTDLRGRKTVCLRLRRNLIFVVQSDGGETISILKDPVSLRFYRLDARQRFAVDLMDGTRTLDEIRIAYEMAHRPQRLALEELESFATQLLASGLAETESPLGGQLLYEQAQAQRRRNLQARLLQVLWIHIPLWDPSRFLGRLLPLTRFVFTWQFALLGMACVLAAVGLVATHWDEFLRKLPGQQQWLQPRTLVYLWIALGLAKIVHELGHGLCCKALGGEVHEMGLMLLLFFPALYCNTSDAWKLPRKIQRLAVSAAGIFVELLLAAAATLVWWLTDGASVLHELALGLMVACSVNTLLFNANPLMRSDGYYLLADALDIANLSELSAEALQGALLRWLGVPMPRSAALGARQETFAVAYALASWTYRVFGVGVSLYLMHLWLKPRKLAILGLAIAAAAAFVLLVWPVWRFVAANYQQRSFREMKPWRIGLSLALVLAAVVIVAGVPLPVYVEAVAVVQVEPGHAVRISVPECGGVLEQLLVHDGQTVQEGQILAVLTNLKQEIALKLNETDQVLRQQQQQDLVVYLAEAVSEKTTQADLKLPDFELESLRQQQAALKKQQNLLILRATRTGVVMGLRSREEVGKWLNGGSELCRVGNPRSLRAVFLVEPGDRQLIHGGSQARLRVHGFGARSWLGSVTDVAQAETGHMPQQLSSKVGGDVATQHDAASELEKPVAPHYLVAVQFSGADPAIHPGVLGRVRVDVGSQTLWWRLRRYLATTFNLGL